MAAWVEVLIDVAIPVAAILVPTWIAVRLARSERKHAAAARAEDQRGAEAMRESERRDRVLEDLIAAYGFFISAHPTWDAWKPAMQLLRARVVLLQTLPTGRTLGEWLATRFQHVGAPAMSHAMSNPYADTPESDEYLQWGRPLSDWAQEEINTVAGWLRGELTDEKIRALLAQASPVPDASS